MAFSDNIKEMKEVKIAPRYFALANVEHFRDNELLTLKNPKNKGVLLIGSEHYNTDGGVLVHPSTYGGVVTVNFVMHGVLYSILTKENVNFSTQL